MPRTMMHHPDQRDSSGFASHMAAITNKPSPLRTARTLRSSDSMPELKLGMSSERNSYTTDHHQEPLPQLPKRPLTQIKSSRLAESVSMSDFEAGRIAPSPDPPVSKPQSSKSEGRMRAKSWHGKQPPADASPFQIEPLPQLPTTTTRSVSEGAWQRRAELLNHTRAQRPGLKDMFDKLPHEVLTMILRYLRALHVERSSSCATCWLRDGCSIALSNKKWRKASQLVMYEDIQLVGPDSAHQMKKYKGVFSTRLVLLRRTLRADPKLAATVRSLKVPALPDDSPMAATEYHDIVASMVMACTNLERLDGFYPIYNHSESRLFNALTTRTTLREMTWVVDAAASEVEVPARNHKVKSSWGRSRHSRQRSSSISTVLSSRSSSPTFLSAAFANKFVRHHLGWSQLTHLTVHCLPGAQLNTPNRMLNVIQTYLISLQSLHLSHVPSDAFNDASLVALPKPLKKLTLSHCLGITTAGLSHFATIGAAQDLETLTLIHQNLETLPAIVRLLAHLSKLTTFSLVQSTAPTLAPNEFLTLMPYLGSQSLRFLHWDVFDSAVKDRHGNMPGTKTDDLLAKSIIANGFPKLRYLRVPCDPDGKFQALCRPKERVELPGDRFRNGPVKHASTGALRSLAREAANDPVLNTTITRPYVSTGLLGPYSSSAINLVLPPMSDPFSSDGRPSTSLSDYGSAKPALPVREAGSDLHKARLLAQRRLEAARGFPLFESNIVDENGVLVESTGLAGYLGDIKSNIIYTLAPDVGASDEHGGIANIPDLLSDRGEDLFGKGDVASRSGAGFGTGCVASRYAKTQALEAEAAGKTKGKGKAKGLGKLTKNPKEKFKEKSKGKSKDKSKDSEDQELQNVREGCTGRWNSYNENFAVDSKVGDRWAHTERGRWKGRVEMF